MVTIDKIRKEERLFLSTINPCLINNGKEQTFHGFEKLIITYLDIFKEESVSLMRNITTFEEVLGNIFGSREKFEFIKLKTYFNHISILDIFNNWGNYYIESLRAFYKKNNLREVDKLYYNNKPLIELTREELLKIDLDFYCAKYGGSFTNMFKRAVTGLVGKPSYYKKKSSFYETILTQTGTEMFEIENPSDL